MTNKIIGRCLLIHILHRLKMTQIELEELTGINRKQINEYIHNKRTMSLKNARVISKALKCHIEDLYEWND